MTKFGVESDGPSFETVPITNIKVGDIVEIEDNDYVPADCILLKTKNYNNKKSAYISTASLDGNNYLTKKYTHSEINDNFDKIFCDKPAFKIKVEST